MLARMVRRRAVFLAVGVLTVAAPAAGGLTIGASAANLGCSLLTSEQVESTLGFAHVRMSESTPEAKGSGSLASRCLLEAWDGPEPAGTGGLKHKLLKREAAVLLIETHVEDRRSHARGRWRGSGYKRALRDTRKEISMPLLGPHRPVRFAPPPFTAEGGLGFEASYRGRGNAVGVWWRGNEYAYVVFSLEAAANRVLPNQLAKLASSGVPVFVAAP
jgi:hypothetical protein